MLDRGRPPQAAARWPALEDVEKVLTAMMRVGAMKERASAPVLRA
jgi:hypothetical protein